MQKKTCDFLIVGGGVIGLTCARALSSYYPDASILLIEKEKQVGLHTSGRNSGVLHAGFYYASESQKAKFCKVGCKEWKDFCLEFKLPLRQCGKIVTAKDETELEYMNALYEQGLKNGVQLELISRSEALKMEPTLRGFGEQVIYSPTTAVMETQIALDFLMK